MGSLRGLVWLAAAFAAAPAWPARAAPVTLDWAFAERPAGGAATPSPALAGRLGVPGSARHYEAAQIGDLTHAVDWFPESHPPAPPVVEGRGGGALACGYCHQSDGQGRPENAALAGLPAGYLAQQVRDIRAGLRVGVHPDWTPTRLMRRAATETSDADLEAAAGYFSSLPYRPAFRLVEAREIPRVEPMLGAYRPSPGGGVEATGARIVEVPRDIARFELRDNRPGYIAYVPPGARARGRVLADGGAGLPACATCHGAALKGGLGPPLAGRWPAYLVRQLLAFQAASRAGAAAGPMREFASRLDTGQMIDLAAYAASLPP